MGLSVLPQDGNTDKLNHRVIVDGEEGMWVLEGDEVVAVNGVSVEGKSLDEAPVSEMPPLADRWRLW